MKNVSVLISAAMLATACGGTNTTTPAASATRGDLVTATLAQSLSISNVAVAIALLGSGASAAFPAKYDVKMYSITYRTVDVDGHATVASGAVFLPINAGTVPLMSYSHGTASRRDVPSMQSLEAVSAGLLFATTGNVVAMADYLGLGSSPGYHPYIHAASEASAGLDALRAARVLAQREGVSLNTKLFVFGYSQGGHAAMALAREIEQHATPEFTLTAAAPMSGPYDVYGTATAYLSDTSPNVAASGYTLYALAAYDTVYHLGPLNQLFKAPYDAVAASLLAGTTTSSQLSGSVAPTPAAMLQPAFLQSLADPASAIVRALHDNDVYDWSPRAPMRLYYGTADRDVPPQNSLTASARMRSLGAANVQAVSLGPLSHGGAIIPAFVAAVGFFNGYR